MQEKEWSYQQGEESERHGDPEHQGVAVVPRQPIVVVPPGHRAARPQPVSAAGGLGQYS